MKFSIVFAILFAVAVAVPRPASDDTDDAESRQAGAAARTVPTIAEIQNGADFKLDDLVSGKLNFSGHSLNNVDGVLLDVNNRLDGLPDLTNTVLLNAVDGTSKNLVVDSSTTPGFQHILCFWRSWINQEDVIVKDINKAIGGLSCDNANKPVNNKIIKTSSGDQMNLKYVNNYGCWLQENLIVPAAMLSQVSGRVGHLPCEKFFKS